MGVEVNLLFISLKLSSHLGVHSNFFSFLRSSVRGFATLEKFSTKRRQELAKPRKLLTCLPIQVESSQGRPELSRDSQQCLLQKSRGLSRSLLVAKTHTWRTWHKGDALGVSSIPA